MIRKLAIAILGVTASIAGSSLATPSASAATLSAARPEIAPVPCDNSSYFEIQSSVGTYCYTGSGEVGFITNTSPSGACADWFTITSGDNSGKYIYDDGEDITYNYGPGDINALPSSCLQWLVIN